MGEAQRNMDSLSFQGISNLIQKTKHAQTEFKYTVDDKIGRLPRTHADTSFKSIVFIFPDIKSSNRT